MTVHIPLAVLNQVEPDGFDWQIPGLREELVTELIRSLPKPIRRSFVPAPNYAKALLERLPAREGALLDGLEREMRRMGARDLERYGLGSGPGARAPEDDLPDPGRPRAQARRGQGPGGAQAAAARPKVRESISAARPTTSSAPACAPGTSATLARTFEQHRRGVAMKAYPALVDEGEPVGVKLLDTPEEQADGDAARRRVGCCC